MVITMPGILNIAPYKRTSVLRVYRLSDATQTAVTCPHHDFSDRRALVYERASLQRTQTH